MESSAALDKHFYGSVVLGERGQVVIPKEARDAFDLKPGDKLIVMGAPGRGIIFFKGSIMREFARKILKNV